MPQAVAWAAYSFVQAAGTLGISQATAVAVLDAAIKTALLAGINAAVQQNNEPEVQGGMVNLTINATEPRRLQIGQRINGGILVDWYVRGSKNQNLYLVIYLGEGPQGRLTGITAGGRYVYNTPINHGVRTTIPDFRSGGDRLWITYYDGRPGQTADANLVSQGLGWTSNCIGDGCAYVIVECQWDEDNLTSPPSLGFETEGAKLYDRRLDTTAGGSGDHRLDDPDTWELSKNPAVALDHYLLGRFTSNGTKAFGVGIDPDDLPYDRFEALANLCDESVTLSGGGSQARYEANGFLFADRTNEDTIKDLCRAMNARPADFGGRVGILDGQSRSAVLTLYDEDVIDTSAEQYRPKRAWAELVNEVRGTYISPTQNYQAVDYPRVTDAAWLSADNDETRETTVNFEMEVNAERAQRLAWLHAMRERRQAQLSGVYHLKAIELEQGDWFVRAGGIFGAGKTFEVIDRSLDPETFTVTITAFEVDAADTAWSTDIPSDPPPDGTPDDSSLAAMEVPAITVTGTTLSGSDSEVPAIKVEWDAPDDPAVRQILIEYAPTGGDVASTLIDVSAGAAVFTNGITDDTDYLVHARFVGAGIPSDWTSDYAVTTSGTFSVGVAQSIVGQGWGATASEGDASNARVKAGANACFDADFRFSNTYWNTFTDGGKTVSYPERTSGLRILQIEGSSLSASDTMGIAGVGKNRIPCAEGETVGVRCFIGATDETTVKVGPVFRDSAGTWLQGSWDNKTAINGNNEIGTFTEFSKVDVAPAGTATVELYVIFEASGSGSPRLRMTRPLLAFLESGQEEPPLFSTGQVAEPGADPTADNTADSIADQGNQATADAGRGNTASRPSSTGSYSWYANTETNTLQLDIPVDGWTDVATLGGVDQISVSRDTGDFVNVKIGSGTNNTGSVVFSASGGVGTITFAHELVVTYTSGPSASITSASGDTTAVSASGTVGQEVRGFVITTATDSEGRSTQFTSPVYLTWET